jgi:hypothetical protein
MNYPTARSGVLESHPWAPTETVRHSLPAHGSSHFVVCCNHSLPGTRLLPPRQRVVTRPFTDVDITSYDGQPATHVGLYVHYPPTGFNQFDTP